MRPWVILALLPPLPAMGGEGPLELFLDCQGYGRTRACPSFIRSYIDDTELLAYTSLADAQVVLYVNETWVATDDRILLRFVSRQDEGLEVFELVVDIDTRQDVDAQSDQLRPAFLRGIAPFLMQWQPEAVSVTLAEPAADVEEEGADKSSPWSVSFGGNGYANWSEARTYASLSGNTSTSYLTETVRFGASAYGSWNLSRQPPLVIGGEEISLDTDSWGVSGDVYAAWNVTEFWSVGVLSGAGGGDPEGRYRFNTGLEVGASRDFFAVDDPRRNSLSVTALLGVECDWYNRTNVLGQDQTCFPTARFSSGGSVQLDTLEF